MSIREIFSGVIQRIKSTVEMTVHENEVSELVRQRQLAEAGINPYTSGDVIIPLPETEKAGVIAGIDAQLKGLGVVGPEYYDTPRNAGVA